MLGQFVIIFVKNQGEHAILVLMGRICSTIIGVVPQVNRDIKVESPGRISSVR